MKIYINRQPVSGPWGGGNKAVIETSKKLISEGHEVVYGLCEDIDIIFCFDPRPNNRGEWYQDFINYKNKTGCKIIQRVGDVGSHGKPELTSLVKETVKLSDFLIFPSQWAKDYINYEQKNCKVIHNAPLEEFYKYRKNNVEEPVSKIKLISHHWSPNPKKGFDFYKSLDNICVNSQFLEFKYVGALPKNMEYSNHIKPTGDNEKIAKIISSSDVYISASQEEAGANHVLEAIACGIPIVYHENGGSILEYCKDYGVSFATEKEMFNAIYEVRKDYLNFKQKVLKYKRNISDVINEYMEIICALK